MKNRKSLLEKINERKLLQTKQSISNGRNDLQEFEDFFTSKLRRTQFQDKLQYLLQKYGISTLIFLKNNLQQLDYNALVQSLIFSRIREGTVLVQKGKKSQRAYIIVSGNATINDEKIIIQNKNELQTIYQAKTGELLGLNSLLSSKTSNYTIISSTELACLEITEEIFSKHLKKFYTREQQQSVNLISQSPFFKNVNSLAIKKYLPYFFEGYYKFNQWIYREGQVQQGLYYIIEGQIELLKYSSVKEENNKVVILGHNEFIGFEKKQNSTHEYSAKVISKNLKLLFINNRTLQKLFSDHNEIYGNLEFYSKRASHIHQSLVKKQNSILQNQDKLFAMMSKKKPKKKKKKLNRTSNSLQWWGLAEKFVNSKKYRMPQRPVTKQTDKLDKQFHEFQAQRTHFSKQLDQFRKRIFQAEMNSAQFDDDDKQNQSPWRTHCMPIKKKIKIQMIDTKPRAIDEIAKTKNKLLTYAKNLGNFCDRLNLQ